MESPAKAKTIQKFLPVNYAVESCLGHVRDLPQSARQIPAHYKQEAWARLGVDVDDEFRPLYVVPEGKKRVIDRLREQLKAAEEVVLATDEDREGEAISWHLVELLRPQVPVRRAVFHEITEDALREAFANFRDIDMSLVSAQETRRVLDRLAGYTMSPLLWKKIAPGLSAGRVQSVALAMIVERETARLRFKPAQYWDLEATLSMAASPPAAAAASSSGLLRATLVGVNGARVATGRDFDGATGALLDSGGGGSGADDESAAASGAGRAGAELVWLREAAARQLCELAVSAEARHRVASVQKRRMSRAPPAPFITSSLQQEASRALHVTAAEVMRTAQSLYENGYITYMRTDSPTLSQQAVEAARAAARDAFGAEHLRAETSGGKRRGGRGKAAKVAAQEAHEAIRPAGRRFHAPAETPLSGRELRLYELVYNRTLASQMKNAELDLTTVYIETSVDGAAAEADAVARDAGAPRVLSFKAHGREVSYAGFYRVYGAPTDGHRQQQRPSRQDESDDSENDGGGSNERALPDWKLREGDTLRAASVEPREHETKPPNRFSEAALVKELETNGVGRPSTYASIIETLVERAYVRRNSGSGSGGSSSALVPTLTAFAVVNLLERHFPGFIDVSFTSEMESALDAIAHGEGDRVRYLRAYYLGDGGLATTVAAKEDAIQAQEARHVPLPALERQQDEKSDDGNCDAPLRVFVGPYGPYVEGDTTMSLPPSMAPEEVTPDALHRMLAARSTATNLGVEPRSGLAVHVRTGKYGPYVQLGGDGDGDGASDAAAAGGEAEQQQQQREQEEDDKEKDEEEEAEESAQQRGPQRQRRQQRGRAGMRRVSIPKSIDSSTLDLQLALRLLSMPRVLGAHPETGTEVRAGYGRYGPFLLHDGEFTRLGSDASDPLHIELAEALQVLRKRASRARSSGGATSDDAAAASDASKTSASSSSPVLSLGEHPSRGGVVEVRHGRFGPYIRHNKVNAKIPDEMDPAAVTLDDAVRLLESKLARGSSGGGRGQVSRRRVGAAQATQR